jgi:hypothetical protein
MRTSLHTSHPCIPNPPIPTLTPLPPTHLLRCLQPPPVLPAAVLPRRQHAPLPWHTPHPPAWPGGWPGGPGGQPGLVLLPLLLLLRAGCHAAAPPWALTGLPPAAALLRGVGQRTWAARRPGRSAGPASPPQQLRGGGKGEGGRRKSGMKCIQSSVKCHFLYWLY